jgi:hypothetical protein
VALLGQFPFSGFHYYQLINKVYELLTPKNEPIFKTKYLIT